MKRLFAAALLVLSTLALVSAPAQAERTKGGYWMMSADGKVYPFGGAEALGSPAAVPGRVRITATPSGNGYWVLSSSGALYNYGDAKTFGLAAMLSGDEQYTTMAATPTGKGYWLFTNKGRVFPFGDAVSYGDMSGHKLNGPVLDAVGTPTGKGYYMVASDGGLFTFGDAQFRGSMGAQRLNKPVMSMAPDADGDGYWLVASDGGIFAFAAPFFGSAGNLRLAKPISGIVASPTGAGYLMVAQDGGIFAYGDVPFHGSLGDKPPASPVVSVAAIGDPPPPAVVGDKLRTNDGNSVQVFSYGPATPSEFASIAAGAALRAIDVQGCVPVGGLPESFNPLYFSLKMTDNTTVDASLGDVDWQIDSGDVSAGDCIRGTVGFEVPAGKQVASVIYQPVFETAVKWAVVAGLVTPDAPDVAVAPAAGPGDTLTAANGSTVQLFSYGPGTPSQFASVPPGASLVAIDVQGCVPTGVEPQSFNPLYFMLKMTDNTTVYAALGDVDGQIDYEDVSAGDCTRGLVAFEVPAGKTPASVLFQPILDAAVRWRVS